MSPSAAPPSGTIHAQVYTATVPLPSTSTSGSITGENAPNGSFSWRVKAEVPGVASPLRFPDGTAAQTVVVATVSPGSNSCGHTLNTLRYAARLKEI